MPEVTHTCNRGWTGAANQSSGTITPAAVALMYLRADQVISVLPVSRRTLSNWQARRLIKFYRVGRTVLFKRTDIEAALEKFAVMPVGTPRPRHRHFEDGNVISEPITPRKRQAGRIVTPAKTTGRNLEHRRR